LVEPTAGRVEVSGKHVLGPGPDRGVVFQKDTVLPRMRVVANVEYGLRCRGVSKTERRGIAMDYLEAVGLHDVAHAWPRELSGGMLKRVAVATVFANGANVLLLDEPFGSLDYVTRHQLHGVLLRLWQEERGGERRVVLFVTHDVDEALTLADRVIVVRDGLLIDDVTIAVARPRTVETLARSEMLGLKHLLLGHLGLESATRPEKLQEQIAKSGSVTESMRRRTNERSAR
jgi:NitT/TauT family transport system ATP-binding protein